MGNYLQFEFDGKMYGWKFNQPTYAHFRSRTANFTNDDYEAYSLYHLLYSGLKTNYVIKGIELDFTWENCCTWADGLTAEQISAMMQIFTAELKFGEDVKDDTAKKKETDKKEDYELACYKMAYGRLKWSVADYYSSSPQEFFYACLGYFDEKEEHLMVMRKVSYSFVGGSLSDFNKFWPVKDGSTGVKELPEDIRKRILELHNIKVK